MNLPYAYELLAAADEQRHGFIKLRGIQADHEVRLMAQAGLVEATLDDGKEGSFTSIQSRDVCGADFSSHIQKSSDSRRSDCGCVIRDLAGRPISVISKAASAFATSSSAPSKCRTSSRR